MTILILCATAKTSRRIAKLLRPDYPLLLASRSGNSIDGSPAVAFDWDLPETWNNIFEHEQAQKSPVTAVYMVMKWLTVDVGATAIPFVDLCIEKGVKRFVQLSGSALNLTDAQFLGHVHGHVKKQCDSKDLEWTVLRPSWYMENFTEVQHYFSIQQSDCFYTAAGDGKIPTVSCDDIARMAYHALTTSEAHNCDYRVVGPENISYDECAQILSEVIGREIRHIKVTPQQLVDALCSLDFVTVPKDYAQLLADFDTLAAEGKEMYDDNSIEKVTGQKPMTFRQFCEANKHVWIK